MIQIISELDEKTRKSYLSQDYKLPHNDDPEYSGMQRLPSVCDNSGHQSIPSYYWSVIISLIQAAIFLKTFSKFPYYKIATYLDILQHFCPLLAEHQTKCEFEKFICFQGEISVQIQSTKTN